MASTYQWGPGAFINANADFVGKELMSLKGNLQGITNEEVVDAAKSDVDSELHKCFEWDDSKAAHMQRLTQASHIIRCVVEIKEDISSGKDKKVHVFTGVTKTNGKREYIPTIEVAQSPDLFAIKQVEILKNIEDLEDDLEELSFLSQSFPMNKIRTNLNDITTIVTGVVPKTAA